VSIAIACEDPRRPDVAALPAEADAWYAGLHATDSNHLLDLDALAGPDAVFLAGRDAGRLCGIGALVDRDGDTELKRMYVAPSARGRGRRLLAALENEARAIGHRLVRLETGIHQPEAQALYRGAGYRDRDPFPPYEEDPLSVFMKKALR
jgi:putative acetyltransferase